MSAGPMNVRDMAAPYQLLLDRLEASIKLRKLLCELLFMVLYSIFFIVFVVLQARTESVSEVNFAVESAFRYKSFPGDSLGAVTFDSISSIQDWTSWFDNVALPTVLETKYASAIGQSRAPTAYPTSSPSHSPIHFTLQPTTLTGTKSPTSPTESGTPTASPFELDNATEAQTPSPVELSDATKAPTASPSQDTVNEAPVEYEKPSNVPTAAPAEVEAVTETPTTSPEEFVPERRRLDSNASLAETGKGLLSGSRRIRSDVQIYFAVLAQKRVRQGRGSDCVQAPNFLWNSLRMFNAPPLTPAVPSNEAVSPICYPSYRQDVEETSEQTDLTPLFSYYSNSPIGVSWFLGDFSTWYPPNGYYSHQLNASFLALWPKAHPGFITSGTRLISFYAVTFNPTYNTWSSIAMFTEVLESGLVVTSTDTITGPLMYSASGSSPDNVSEMALASVAAVFIILHLIFIVVIRRVYALYCIIFRSGIRGKGRVFCAWVWDILDFWVVLDIAQCALGIVSLQYISEVYWMHSRYNDLLKVSLDKLSMEDVAMVNQYLWEYTYIQQIFGVQIILFNIQVFKYFPALPCFFLVRLGWYNAYLEVIKVFIMYWVLIFFYAFVAWISFGQVLIEVSSYANALNNVIRMILGEATFDALRQNAPAFAWVYLYFFVIVFLYLMQALFLSVVIEGFRLAFNSREANQKSTTKARDVLNKMARNDYAMSSEYAKRLRAWKALKTNRNADDISWVQLRAALRGHVHNRLDVPDETIDEVFLLVNGMDLKPAKQSRVAKLDDSSPQRINSGDVALGGQNTSFVLQMVKNMFELKANERNVMKQLGSLMKEMRRSQVQSETLLGKADEASSRFARDE